MDSHNIVESKLEPWFQLNGKVVMVTGASSGLGWELSLDLAKAGCKNIATARRVDRLKSLCDHINNKFKNSGQDQPKAMTFEFDISSSKPVIKACVEKAWHAFGRIDALINNAGVRGRVHPPLDLSEDEWNSIVRTNQTGTWLVSKYVCMHMRDAKHGGSIINISSAAAINRVQFHGGHAYAASKSAIHSITKVMAMELRPYNIRVNSIAPGIFESEITKGLLQKQGLRTVLSRITPLNTLVTIDLALTSLIRYLIDHDSSQYVTDNIFIADAGVTLPGVPIFSSL